MSAEYELGRPTSYTYCTPSPGRGRADARRGGETEYRRGGIKLNGERVCTVCRATAENAQQSYTWIYQV